MVPTFRVAAPLASSPTGREAWCGVRGAIVPSQPAETLPLAVGPGRGAGHLRAFRQAPEPHHDR